MEQLLNFIIENMLLILSEVLIFLLSIVGHISCISVKNISRKSVENILCILEFRCN